MASKTASKTKAKRKGGKRNKTPALDNCPYVADFTYPHSTESSGKQATDFLDFRAAKDKWTAEVRQAFDDGKPLPVFSVKKFPNLNIGRESRAAHEKFIDAYNAAIDKGVATPASLPRYNPVMVNLVHAMNCPSLRSGSIAQHAAPPKNWDEKQYGSWWHEYQDDDDKTIKEPSGWFVDSKLPRACHADKAEDLIDDPDKNILTFGNLRIVCGTGTHDGSAVFRIWQTSHGNYRDGDSARKRMSLAGIKEIRDLVFRIEDRPNNGGGVTVKGLWTDVREMVYLPGQVLTVGNLYDAKGKLLDAKAIRALDSDTKGLRFKTLEAPIVGPAIPFTKLWAEIQITGKASIKTMRGREGRSAEYLTGSVQTRTITNLCVHGKRVDPSEATPFGLKGSQIHMPAYIVATGDGKIEDGCFSMGVVVGARANAPYNVGVYAAKGETEVTKAEPKSKPKAAEKKSKKTTAKKPTTPGSPPAEVVAEKDKAVVAEKDKAAKPQPEPTTAPDAAPPVEVNTADEPVVVTETVTVAE